MEFSLLSFVVGAAVGAGGLSLQHNWKKLFGVTPPPVAEKAKRKYTRKPKKDQQPPAPPPTPTPSATGATVVPNGMDTANTIRSSDTYQS